MSIFFGCIGCCLVCFSLFPSLFIVFHRCLIFHIDRYLLSSLLPTVSTFCYLHSHFCKPRAILKCVWLIWLDLANLKDSAIKFIFCRLAWFHYLFLSIYLILLRAIVLRSYFCLVDPLVCPLLKIRNKTFLRWSFHVVLQFQSICYFFNNRVSFVQLHK